MVTKNEASRYLTEALDWLDNQVDQIFVYDDDSDDETRDIASHYGVVCRRQPSVSTFLEHEGRFRTAALRTLETVVHPHDGDWIFVADADEFFVPNTDRLEDYLSQLQPHHQAVRTRIHSVWDIVDGELFHRVDGPWSTLNEPRLWKWREGLAFADTPMACRNEPVMVTMQPGLIYEPETGSAILHYGYASHADRARRHTRYTSELSYHGHSEPFIDSIMDPRVAWGSWTGEIPCGIK